MADFESPRISTQCAEMAAEDTSQSTASGSTLQLPQVGSTPTFCSDDNNKENLSCSAGLNESSGGSCAGSSSSSTGSQSDQPANIAFDFSKLAISSPIDKGLFAAHNDHGEVNNETQVFDFSFAKQDAACRAEGEVEESKVLEDKEDEDEEEDEEEEDSSEQEDEMDLETEDPQTEGSPPEDDISQQQRRESEILRVFDLMARKGVTVITLLCVLNRLC